jgi:hypothetical protein
VRFHKSGKRFQVSICAGPSESSVHANFVELRLLEVRILGILRSQLPFSSVARRTTSDMKPVLASVYAARSLPNRSARWYLS